MVTAAENQKYAAGEVAMAGIVATRVVHVAVVLSFWRPDDMLFRDLLCVFRVLEVTTRRLGNSCGRCPSRAEIEP